MRQIHRLFFLALVITLATGGYVFGGETANPSVSCATAGQTKGCGASASASSGSCATEGDTTADETGNCDNGECQKRNDNDIAAQNRQCSTGKQADSKSERKSRSSGWSCPMMSMR